MVTDASKIPKWILFSLKATVDNYFYDHVLSDSKIILTTASRLLISNASKYIDYI